MPRRRMGRRGSGASGVGDRGAWGQKFTKTRLCKFNTSGQCIRGDDCSFAHEPQELRTPPDLRMTKICNNLHLLGFCEKGDSCSFAHSEEELRAMASSALQLLITPAQCDLDWDRRVSSPKGDTGRFPDSLPFTCAGNFDLTSTSSWVLGQSVDLTEAEVAKPVTASSELIWSQQTTVPATSSGWSLQTITQEEVPRGLWGRRTSDDFQSEAFVAFKMQELCSGGIIDPSSGEDSASLLSNSDGELELQVHNTFLAALPRRRRDRRASSLPTRGSFFQQLHTVERVCLTIGNFA
mmetsp:Transcript_49333/g.107421  ORF Transcript_49333/g.107421 Transcript_49333/m.107421 type:complete len:294 (-) Transcript_49333:36-917(-)